MNNPVSSSLAAQADTDTATPSIRRRRRALAHLIRGACYGIGSGIVGLGFFVLERLL
ncbi:hypothetical protein [Streptomyces sp. NPDC017941]|uniref:hypothetical protein n=1 Tax=Streptomyces sp. NPDC017941 TaxID=3365018 RepID=UPI0037B106D4